MDGGAGDELQWPFVGQAHETENEVDDLKSGEGLDGAIEVLGEEVPEDLGPEEAFNGGSNLVWRALILALGSTTAGRRKASGKKELGRTDGGGEDDEARPVVLDELSHGGECGGVEREDD